MTHQHREYVRWWQWLFWRFNTLPNQSVTSVLDQPTSALEYQPPICVLSGVRSVPVRSNTSILASIQIRDSGGMITPVPLIVLAVLRRRGQREWGALSVFFVLAPAKRRVNCGEPCPE